MFWPPNQDIRIISKGCDTEDWRNGCWNFSFAITGINYILEYTKIKIIVIIFYNIAVYCILDQIESWWLWDNYKKKILNLLKSSVYILGVGIDKFF